ncbi:uncharacterized protein [Pleurodeles waltl]|uniref:uncharacterized protein n=1 Tax=Pleurodeles waltl TaxID=8319 RepID=UPI003709C5BD
MYSQVKKVSSFYAAIKDPQSSQESEPPRPAAPDIVYSEVSVEHGKKQSLASGVRNSYSLSYPEVSKVHKTPSPEMKKITLKTPPSTPPKLSPKLISKIKTSQEMAFPDQEYSIYATSITGGKESPKIGDSMPYDLPSSSKSGEFYDEFKYPNVSAAPTCEKDSDYEQVHTSWSKTAFQDHYSRQPDTLPYPTMTYDQMQPRPSSLESCNEDKYEKIAAYYPKDSRRTAAEENMYETVPHMFLKCTEMKQQPHKNDHRKGFFFVGRKNKN